jgi:hypothetical protein
MTHIEEINLIRFLSKPKVSPFAPEWNYSLGESFIKNINFNEIQKLAFEKEKEILKLPNTIRNNKLSDGYTGLGKNSTTSRFDQYNVLKWNNIEIKKLKNAIIEMHSKFLTLLQIDKPKVLFAQCWLNIMRKGEQIKPHIHSTTPESYLGGHICIKCNDTSTYYINPVNQLNEPEIYTSKNEVGKITLFQNCIPHYTDVNNDNERITIAFDLEISKGPENEIQLY